MSGGQDVKFLGFEVLLEPWNIYRLSDGTTLKIKFILQKMRIEKDTAGIRVIIASSNMAVVEAPERLRGPPAPAPQQERMDQAIVEPGMEFDVVKDSETIYSLSDGGLMKVKTRLIRVAKTSLFGPDGDPIYKVDTANEVAIMQGPPADRSGDVGTATS